VRGDLRLTSPHNEEWERGDYGPEDGTEAEEFAEQMLQVSA